VSRVLDADTGGRVGAAFGARLRGLRARAGLSREDLAERAGLGVTTLAALERGERRRPHPHTLVRLAEALGLPEPERAALLELASGVEASPGETEPATEPVAVPSIRPLRLPVPPTPLIGREADVAAAGALLEPTTGSARLLTLLGPGGVGKTRLAVAIAAALAKDYADGVVFVELAALRDPRLVPATIARSLGLHESGGRSASEQVLEALRDQHLLLVLDNFEHVLDAATLLTPVLANCAGVRLLATSRAALRLAGERRYRVLPLATPADDVATLEAAAASPAVHLFMERAQAVMPRFVLDLNNAAAVGAICRRLDGLPLAIELAAARANLLGPAALLRRLEQRLPLLTRGAADLPERQQTLRATLAWSHDLLGPAEQLLLRRLAVFAGGWSLEAAEAVCGGGALPGEEVLDRLQVLIDNSLVHRLDAATTEPRFGMLETVREFAQEVLETSDEALLQRERHATHFLALAEEAEPRLTGADQRAWFVRLDQELDNLRAAVSWARSSGHFELGLRQAAALAMFFEERGHVREGCEWLEMLMQAPEIETAVHLAQLRARALATAGWLRFLQGDYERAAPLAEQSLGLWRQLGQVGNSSVALNTLAHVARRDGDAARHKALCRASLDLCRAQGDTRGTAAVLSWLSSQHRAEGDLEGASALLEESLRLFQATSSVGGIAYVLLHMGGVARARGDSARAETLTEESLRLYRSLGDDGDVAYATGALAGLAAEIGDGPRARRLCSDAVATFRHLGDNRGLAEELRLLGWIATQDGDDTGAAAAFDECLRLRHVMSSVQRAFCMEGLALARARIGGRLGSQSQLHSAVRLLGAAHSVRAELHDAASVSWSISLLTVSHPEYAGNVAALRAVLGDAAFEAAWAAGVRLSMEHAIVQALEDDAATVASAPQGRAADELAAQLAVDG
jgi:predicted ATPase/transcriptional regulator with XRE-family HTH domain